MKLSQSLVMSVLLLGTPGIAAAQSAPGPDEIRLKNGGMLRGTVVSVEPGSEAVILVQGTGKERHVPWSQIEKVNRAKDAAPSAPAPSPPPPPVEEHRGQDGAPRVHVESERPGLTLHRVTGAMNVSTFGAYGYGGASLAISQAVCVAPCDRIVDGRDGQDFFFTGEGVRPSARFTLVGKGPEVSASVRAGTTASFAGGWIATSLGAGFIAGGAVMMLLGSTTTVDDYGNLSPPDSGVVAAGGVMLGVGVGTLAAGIVLLVRSRTMVDFKPQATARGLSFSF